MFLEQPKVTMLTLSFLIVLVFNGLFNNLAKLIRCESTLCVFLNLEKMDRHIIVCLYGNFMRG